MERGERETTVAWNEGETVAYIYSTVPKHIRAMLKDDRYTMRDGDGSTWGSFTIGRADFDPLKGLRRRTKPMTDEQRAAAAERLKRARESR